MVSRSQIPAVDNGRLAAGAQLPHQPLSGGLPVQVGHMLGEGTVAVDALEALAAVLSTEDRPREAAVLVGAADAQRGSASSPRRPPQPPHENLRRSLVQALGRSAFDEAHTEGQSLYPTEALRLTTSPQPDRNASSP
jgi:hypothetical protein